MQIFDEIAVLIIEDSESDAALILHELESKGIRIRSLRIESANELKEALAEKWDIILSDFRLPQFNAITALEIVQAVDKDIPFIIVSQAIGEGIAVELMRAGAVDYVMKSSLKRLGPAVEREVREASIRKQARADAAALVNSEKNFRLLAENSADLISRHEPNGVYTYASPAFTRVLGFKPEELVGHSAYEFFHPDDLAAIQALHTQANGPNGEAHVEYRLGKKDGGYIWAQSISRSLVDQDTGEVIEIQVSTRDISERKLAEIALKESEKRLLAAQSVAKIGSWETDLQTLKVIWSAETYRIFGLSADEFEASHPNFLDYVHPDDRKGVDDAFMASISSTGSHIIEHRVLTPNGELKYVEERWQIILNGQGQPAKAFGTCQDITERKKAETKLKENEIFLNSIIESQINGVVVVSKAGVITVANDSAAEILQLQRDLVTGSYFQEADHWRQIDLDYNSLPPEALPLAVALGQQKRVRNFEHGIQLPDGTTKWLNVSASPIHDANGGLTGAVASFIDVTEQHIVRQKMVRQLERLRLQERAINSSMNGVIIADARMPDMPVTFVNDAFTRITGYLPRDVIGRNCRFLQGSDSDQGEIERMRDALKNRQGGEFTVRNYRKDGTLFHTRLQLAPVKDESGEVTHFVAIQTDISEKHAAERELERARERMELALQGAQLGLIDIDFAKGTTYFSPRFAEIIGYSHEELSEIFNSWRDFTHMEDLPHADKTKLDHLAGLTRGMEAELRFQHKDGHWVWVLYRGRVVERSPGGKPVRFTGTILDITERKDQVRKIMELSQQMLNISEVERAEISSELHDVIGQSLVLLKLNLLKFLRENNLRTEENERVLLAPVADTLNKVRDISRRLTPSHMKKVGLQLAVEDMLESAQALSGIQIQTDLAALDSFFPDNWSIPCFRVIQEAITNALKHSGASRIRVSTARLEHNLEIVIADNGQGFVEEGDAQGIGFSLMRERIRGLRGHLFVNSSPMGVELHVLIPSQAV